MILNSSETFLTVWEARGFKPAAEQLNKTPAAVSLQIRRLEEILDQRVLERSNQGISLTSAGVILREKGLQLISLNNELMGDFLESDLVGQLNFGAPADYAPTLLQRLLPIFRREFPRTIPNIILEPSRVLRPRVAADTLDMAIVARENSKEKGFDLWREELDWFGNASGSDGKPHIGTLTTDCILRDYTLDKLKSIDHKYKIVMETATVASLKEAVAADFCQALLPLSITEDLVKSASLASVKTKIITFCIIAGSRFDAKTTERVSRKFKRVL